MAPLKFNSTADIKVSKELIDQVIGQDAAVEVMKKSAKQRRHVLLIGEPGTGVYNVLPKYRFGLVGFVFFTKLVFK